MTNKSTASNWFFGGYPNEEQLLLERSILNVNDRLEKIGINAFIKLYDENREAFDVFTSHQVLPSSKEAIEHSESARQHCLRVMKSIELCISKLNKEERFVDYTRALASRHCGFGIKAGHFLSLFDCLRKVLLNEIKAVNQPHRRNGSCGNVEGIELSSLTINVSDFSSTSNSTSDNQVSILPSDSRGVKIEDDIDTISACPVQKTVDSQVIARHSDVGTFSNYSKAKVVHFQRSPVIPIDSQNPELKETTPKLSARRMNSTSNDLGSKKENNEIAVWNKFFLTMTLAMINGVEISLKSRQDKYTSRKVRSHHRPTKPPGHNRIRRTTSSIRQ